MNEFEIQKLRERLIRLEGQVEVLYRHLGLPYVNELDPSTNPKLIEQLKKGNLIEAIKIHREITGAGLAEAKTAVEEIKARLGY